MKAAFALSLAVVFAITFVGFAAEKPAVDKADKEVTLEGSVCCAKCELKLKDQEKCATVIVVKDGGKEKVYWFDADAHKKFHENICKTPTKATCKGTVTEKDGKLTITVSECKFAK